MSDEQIEPVEDVVEQTDAAADAEPQAQEQPEQEPVEAQGQDVQEGDGEQAQAKAEAPKPAAADADQKELERLQAQQQELEKQEQELLKQLEDIASRAEKEDGLDPIEDFGPVARTFLNAIRSLQRKNEMAISYIQAQQQAQAAEQQWQQWSQQSGISVEQGKKLWAEEIERFKNQYSGEALRAAARVSWENRIERILAAKRGAGKSAPNNSTKSVRVTPAGARVTPPGTSAKAPPPQPETIEEKMARGDYGPLHLLAT